MPKNKPASYAVIIATIIFLIALAIALSNWSDASGQELPPTPAMSSTSGVFPPTLAPFTPSPVATFTATPSPVIVVTIKPWPTRTVTPTATPTPEKGCAELVGCVYLPLIYGGG